MTTELETKVNELIAKVENMTSVEYMELISNMTRFYNYSFRNKMILTLQGCSQVASFNKWKELERPVKKGAKANFVLAPMTKKIREENINGEEIDRVIITGFKSVPVFDISQTEGEEIERGMTTKAEISLDHVLKAAQSLGVTVAFKPLEIALGGYVSSNEIVLNSNLNSLENTGTLIHELAHYMLGHTTTSTHLKTDVVEQEAETVTALICAEFGIERKSDFYLKGWGTENILNAMSKMTKAYNEIMAALAA